MSTKITACAFRIDEREFFAGLGGRERASSVSARKIVRGTVPDEAFPHRGSKWVEMVDGQPSSQNEGVARFNYVQSGPWFVLFAWDQIHAESDIAQKLSKELNVDGCYFCINDQVGWHEMAVFDSGTGLWNYTYNDGEVLGMEGVSPEAIFGEKRFVPEDKRDEIMGLDEYNAIPVGDAEDGEGRQREAFQAALGKIFPIDLEALAYEVDDDSLGACRIWFTDQTRRENSSLFDLGRPAVPQEDGRDVGHAVPLEPEQKTTTIQCPSMVASTNEQPRSEKPRKGTFMVGVVFLGLVASIVGGSVLIYKHQMASAEANSEKRQEEENAYRRRLREKKAAGENRGLETVHPSESSPH